MVKIMKNKLLFSFLIVLLPFILVKPALAGFGVSPAEIYNDSLKPGATFDKEVVLSRSTADENLKVVIETELGEAESWFTFNPGKEFIFAKGENRKTVKITVSVPKNANLKNYKGVLRIKASSVDSANSGVSIVQGARMEVNLVTTSINLDLLNIKGLNMPEAEFQKPLKLLINVENNGNTEIAPSKIILEIEDLNKNTIETQEVAKLEKVSANTTKEITAEFKNTLNSGEYFGIVKVYLGDKLLRSDRLVFKVGAVPEGYKATSSQNINFFAKIISAVKENKIETAVIASLIALPIIVGLFLFKMVPTISLKIIFITATLIFWTISGFFTNQYHQNRLKDLAKPNDQGAVQGETIEITPTEAPKVNSQTGLVVNQATASYPIYRTPNTKSEIVYTATENEKLNVVSTIDGWYQVSTGNGTGGWLPQSSVKKTQ